MRSSPATMRSSDDLPAPLRPATIKPSPPATEKLMPAENLASAAPAGKIKGRKPH